MSVPKNEREWFSKKAILRQHFSDDVSLLSSLFLASLGFPPSGVILDLKSWFSKGGVGSISLKSESFWSWRGPKKYLKMFANWRLKNYHFGITKYRDLPWRCFSVSLFPLWMPNEFCIRVNWDSKQDLSLCKSSCNSWFDVVGIGGTVSSLN